MASPNRSIGKLEIHLVDGKNPYSGIPGREVSSRKEDHHGCLTNFEFGVGRKEAADQTMNPLGKPTPLSLPPPPPLPPPPLPGDGEKYRGTLERNYDWESAVDMVTTQHLQMVLEESKGELHPFLSILIRHHDHKGYNHKFSETFSNNLKLEDETEEVKEGSSTGEMEVLIQWHEMTKEEATWEDYQKLQQQIPGFHLEDKVKVWAAGIDKPQAFMVCQRRTQKSIQPSADAAPSN